MPDVKTATLRKVAVGSTTETLPTTWPTAGGTVSWGTTWTLIGGQSTTDIYIAADTVSFDFVYDATYVDPPLAQLRLQAFPTKNGVESVKFKCYQANHETLAISSFYSTTSNGYSETVTPTYKQLCFELSGQGVIYLPYTIIRIAGIEAGVKDLMTIDFEVDVFGTASLPYGAEYIKFASA